MSDVYMYVKMQESACVRACVRACARSRCVSEEKKKMKRTRLRKGEEDKECRDVCVFWREYV